MFDLHIPLARPFARALTLLLCLAGIPASAETSRPPLGPLGEREVIVVNQARHSIVGVFASPAEAQDWGEERLGDQVIEPGRRRTLHLGRMRDCGFDLRIIYDDGTREEHPGVNLCRMKLASFDGRNVIAPPPPDLPTHRLTLTNRSRLPVQQVFISAEDANDWGNDLISGRSLSVDASAPIEYRGSCLADLRVVFTNQAAEERRGLNFCQIQAMAIEPGWTTDGALAQLSDNLIEVVNRSGHRLLALELQTGAGLATDVLAGQALPDGERRRVGFDRKTGCRFGVRMVFAPPAKPRDTDVDLCRTEATVMALP